jgi:hypothetical protein
LTTIGGPGRAGHSESRESADSLAQPCRAIRSTPHLNESQPVWDQVLETHGGRSEEEEVEVEEPQHPRRCVEAECSGPQRLPTVR